MQFRKLQLLLKTYSAYHHYLLLQISLCIGFIFNIHRNYMYLFNDINIANSSNSYLFIYAKFIDRREL